MITQTVVILTGT